MRSAVVSRDPENRATQNASIEACKEKMLDKTIADSFPASDPPSSLPNPCVDSFAYDLPGSELQEAA
jgi:hypothetical protein